MNLLLATWPALFCFNVHSRSIFHRASFGQNVLLQPELRQAVSFPPVEYFCKCYNWCSSSDFPTSLNTWFLKQWISPITQMSTELWYFSNDRAEVYRTQHILTKNQKGKPTLMLNWVGYTEANILIMYSRPEWYLYVYLCSVHACLFQVVISGLQFAIHMLWLQKHGIFLSLSPPQLNTARL